MMIEKMVTRTRTTITMTIGDIIMTIEPITMTTTGDIMKIERVNVGQ